MKTIIVIISMILIALDLSVPGDKAPEDKHRQQSISCVIGYTEDEEAFIYEDSLAHCNVIEVRTLPPLENATIPVKARFIKGSYTLKAAASAGLDVGYDFILEDNLTGKTFNLKSETPYSFNVSRTIPDRFVIHVKKSGAVSSK